MNKSKLIVVFAVLLLSQSYQTLKAQGFPASPVNVIIASKQSLSPVSWVSGTVVSRNNSQIAAEVSGRLISVAEIGARVKQGEIIARIDDTNLQIQKRENIASVDNAKARLKFLESEVVRKTSLAKRNLSTITDLDDTVSQRDVAKGDLIVARARLAQTQQNLLFSQLRAPFDGLVMQRLSNLGEYINAGTAIVRLVETENLEASAFTPLTAYTFLQQVQSLAVESPLGSATAPIKSLVPVADSRSHLMEVRLDMSALDWPVGLDIKVAIASGDSREVLAVPRDALVLRREGASIFRVNQDNKAEKISVTVGIGAGELIEVIGDVNAGDRIVIRGAERLQPGQAVAIKATNKNLISGDQ